MLTPLPKISELSQIMGTNDSYITLAGTTEIYSSFIPVLKSGQTICQIQIEVNFDATPTDNVQINIYSSLDGINQDNVALDTFIIDNASDPGIVSISISNIFYLIVGAQQTGSTDSHDIRAYERRY